MKIITVSYFLPSLKTIILIYYGNINHLLSSLCEFQSGRINISLFLWFQGDLNYRKLLEDRSWAPDSEKDKLTAFGRCFPPNIEEGSSLMMTLRVAKADVAVGLTPERLQEVRARDPQWWVKGLFGFIQIIRWLTLLSSYLLDFLLVK